MKELGDQVANLCKVEAPEPSLAGYLFDNQARPQKQQPELSLGLTSTLLPCHWDGTCMLRLALPFL